MDWTLSRGRYGIIHVSGGRTSAYMLRRILDLCGSLPDNIRAVFCNTGKERPETLDFLNEIETRWQVPIVWLEYDYREESKGGIKDPKRHYRVVDYATASRDGEPFDALIRAKKMLPNISMRFCTEELKIETARRWAQRGLGWHPRDVIGYLGIRADEPERIRKAIFKHCRTAYPLFDAGVTETEVLGFWNRHSFDLQLRTDQSNCDACFLKGKRNLVRLLREEPAIATWWIDQEDKRGKTFSSRYSYRELLADGSFDLPFDEPAVSCFCGD